MSIRSQLLKGILEGCILAIIERKSVYGYELSMLLHNYGIEVSEGSIYPILLRLQKEMLIRGEVKKSQSGPNRKYYSLTDSGARALNEFQIHWLDMKVSVDQLLDMGDKN
ncbi:PadR family transcriptional regulator [Anaerobacillus alkalidiazotrophicus]|uniref:PadR family transcriptional regulator n=1 Tax=Anaerobacillus alkalidiazotrophicus TaxID=472963 RepID=A0A1S2M656_9BACI|nr:PadR family transcriptional regulator [Anaerobacillus alkalidiazotrophicus]OIJ20114.1 PadR family transcriptional regulator [Anaerobacillus alkalidiazotrophicus]